jgi:GNAT superfamily N-acetyltransferase
MAMRLQVASGVGRHRLPDGTVVELRHLAGADRRDLVDGFAGLSRRSRYLRFFSAMPTLPESVLDRLIATDGLSHVAICARRVAADGTAESPIVGVARYVRDAAEPDVAEPAVAVIDALQRQGLGQLLLRVLAAHARSHGITRYRAHTLASNERVRRILARARGNVVDHDGPVLVYDVDIRVRRRRPLRDFVRALRGRRPSGVTPARRGDF